MPQFKKKLILNFAACQNREGYEYESTAGGVNYVYITEHFVWSSLITITQEMLHK